MSFKPPYVEGEKLYWGNGKYLGDVVRDVDGYYKWWPDSNAGGCWEDYSLMAIASVLYEMNKEWDAEVEAYFKENS